MRTADMQGPGMECLLRSLTMCLYIFSAGSREETSGLWLRGLSVLVAQEVPSKDLSHPGWGCWRKSKNHF